MAHSGGLLPGQFVPGFRICLECVCVGNGRASDYGIMFIGFAAAGYFGPTIMRNVYASYGIYQPAFQIACGLNLAGILLAVLYRMMNKKTKSTGS